MLCSPPTPAPPRRHPPDLETPGPRELLRPPTALLALEDAAAGQGETDAGSYRLAQCAVHESGALLLELRDGEAYDRQLRSRARQPGLLTAAAAALAAAAAAAGGDAAGAGGAGGEEWYDDDGGGDDWAGGDDGASDGGGIDMDDGLAAPPGAGAEDAAAAAAAAEGMDDDDTGAPGDAGDGEAPAAEPAGAALRQRGARGVGDGGRVAAAKETFDPYKLLDPNDKGSLLIKPLQVGRRRGAAARTAAMAGACRL